MEICITKTKKSSPDMFIFYVDVAGHDMVTDAGRSTTCRPKFKAQSLQTYFTENEGPPENIGLRGKLFENIRQKDILGPE